MRTLIISRPDRVGDVVISTSCLAPIRRQYPGAKIYFVAAERMRPLLEGHPFLAGFISLSSDLTAEFRRIDASAIVHLHPHKECYQAARRAGVPIRIGYPARFLNRHLTRVIAERRKEGLLHEAAYNFDLLRPLKITPPEKFAPAVQLPESGLHALQRKLPWPLASTRFAVLGPSAHSKFARWPVERFLGVARRLQKEFDLLPIFIGANANDSIPPGASNYLNLAGQTDLAELGWLLRHARVLVTNDTGPAHLAAAVGCPQVTLFGRNAPLYGQVRWRPLSDKAVVLAKPLSRKPFEGRAAHWQRCFAAISEEEVAAAVRQILATY